MSKVQNFKQWCETKGVDMKNFWLNNENYIEKRWDEIFKFSENKINHKSVWLSLENQYQANQQFSDNWEDQRNKRLSIPLVIRIFRNLPENFKGSLSEGNQILSVDINFNKIFEQLNKDKLHKTPSLDTEAEVVFQIAENLALALRNKFQNQNVGVCRLEFKENSIDIRCLVD